MNIIYISYWGILEGITESTVLPHIKILSEYPVIEKIFLITIERDNKGEVTTITDKSYHIPVQSNSRLFPVLGKFIDFFLIPSFLQNICIVHQIDTIIARGSMAGSIAYLLSKRNQIPFYVESFEPHSEYMKDSGTWKHYGLKYRIQKYWENKQRLHASGLLTVSNSYTKYLNESLSREIQILTASCAVDLKRFSYNIKDKEFIRKKLGFINDEIVAIYVGKFGGLYYDINNLDIFKTITNSIPNLGVIILTPGKIFSISNKLNELVDSGHKVIIKNVSHCEVPRYLSAADFAISLVKPFKSAKYTSPIKHGEYWANGLPILMTEGIGDERNFLEKEKGGVLFNENNLMSSLEKLQEILDDPGHRTRIPELARKYRSFDKVKEAYEKMIISPGK